MAVESGPLIMVVEDEVEIADILMVYLRHEGFTCEHAGDGRQALELLRRHHPALVILDIRLPGQNGIDILQAIRGESGTPVIMLTALTDDVNKLVSLRLGADDYISKPFNPAEVVARVHAVLRRTSGLKDSVSGEILSVGNLHIDTGTYSASVQQAGGDRVELPLTLTEFRLLAFLARQPRRCFTRNELIESCLPESDALDRVIDSHLSKLRKKLQEAGGADLIETVRGVGYRLWYER
ncbi:MAG: response regulator transcription factor [Pseudomonadales bacterium]|nr:response regulator transcription factor [Pseudomonadales bacterium]